MSLQIENVITWPVMTFDGPGMGALPDGEHRERFISFGAGSVVEPSFRFLDEAILHWAAVQPDMVAVVHEKRSITYGELATASAQLADHLISRGVMPGDSVGLFLRRGLELVVGILGTLRAGAAYVPQDAKVATAETLEAVVAATRPPVVLTTREWQHVVPALGTGSVVEIDSLGVVQGADLPGPPRRSPDDNCFVLFTSGTTGKPNGVQVSHANVANIVLTEPGNLGMRPGVSVAQILSISFDMSAWEILGALGNGATLNIRGESIQDAASASNIVIATPSVLATIDPVQCPFIETVAVAGEPCPVPLAEAWARHGRFYNSCGPTETTIINTAQEFEPGGPLTIGRPTPNNTVYILDDALRPLPIGEVGEMWAGGDCVTNGYLDNPTLTSDRYRPDPFLGGGKLMFRTRDLGRWTPTGELEHHGRTDDQVKVRGFRVELDSVSSVLEREERCTSATTLKVDDRTLVSFVQPASVDTASARSRVASTLPYYAVPERVIAIDALPTTPRGKVDKRALLAMLSRGAES